MKHLLYFLLFLPWCLAGQNLFTQITDPGNPAVSFNNTPALYKGAAWIDLDSDHYPDLFVSQKFLFHNLGNGNFEQLPDVAGVTLGQDASGSSWGDIDNDGDPDCISASVVCGLHYNNGDNTFSPQNTLLADFSTYRGWDCSLADADNNGLLDLFFAHADNFPQGSAQQPCKLYLQLEKDSFSLVTGYEFSSLFKPYTIPVWTDFDLDGDMDLLIGSGPGGAPGPDFCYRNLLKESGTFSLERLASFPFNELQDGQVYNAIDFDNDGDLDICLTNYAGAKTRFYVNNDGVYLETPNPFTIQGGLLSNAWADLDNDGDLDVLVSVDGDPNIFFYRNNAGVFASAVSLGAAGNGICGIALADYDNDGDLDIYTNGKTTARALFRNDSAALGNNWAEFSLQGQQSNHSAIGALLRIKATIAGQPVWQIREISAHNSFQSQHDLRQHIGLGDAGTIDSLIVRWPSGLVQVFTSLAGNNFFKLVENQGIELLMTNTSAPEALRFEVKPNPGSGTFELLAKQDFKYFQCFDSSGKNMLLQYEFWGNKATVHFPGNAPSGNYFIRAWFKNGQSGVQQVLKL